MKNIHAATLLAVLLSTAGCGYSQFAGKTGVTYEVTQKTPEGITTITKATWENTKDEQGVRVKINPRTGEVTLSVDKSGSNSEATAAASESSLKAQENFAKMLDLVKDLAAKTATKGAVPVP